MKDLTRRIISVIVGIIIVVTVIVILYKNVIHSKAYQGDVLKAENAVDLLLEQKQLENETYIEKENSGSDNSFSSLQDSVNYKEHIKGNLENLYDNTNYNNKELWLTDDEVEKALGKKVYSSSKKKVIEVSESDLSNNEDEAAVISDITSTNTSVDGLVVTYLDVGQGDCTLIQCNDMVMLIDGGDNSVGTKIQNYLQKQGIKRIDYLICTHPDADHCGGLDVVITKFDIGKIFVSKFKKDTRTEEDMYSAIYSKNYSYAYPCVGNNFLLGDAHCYILGPLTYDVADANEASIIVKLIYGTTSFLFMGDAPTEVEEALLSTKLDVRADVIKLGHHGSNTSSSSEWLDNVHPKAAVVSCALGNEYGHPHPSVLNYLRKNNISLYRTDEAGTIIATSDGNDISFNVPSGTWTTGWDYQ